MDNDWLSVADLSRRWCMSWSGAKKRTERPTFPTATVPGRWHVSAVEKWEGEHDASTK